MTPPRPRPSPRPGLPPLRSVPTPGRGPTAVPAQRNARSRPRPTPRCAPPSPLTLRSAPLGVRPLCAAAAAALRSALSGRGPGRGQRGGRGREGRPGGVPGGGGRTGQRSGPITAASVALSGGAAAALGAVLGRILGRSGADPGPIRGRGSAVDAFSGRRHSVAVSSLFFLQQNRKELRNGRSTRVTEL